MKRYLLAIAAAVLFVGIGLFCLLKNQSVFTGSRVRNPDCYLLDFEKMNQVDTHELSLSVGDILNVDFEIRKGHADLMIGIENSEPIYRGNDIDQGSFEVTIPEDGDYQICVDARNASGMIHIILE